MGFLSQQPVFNSLTNCLGPRKLLHSGKLYKAKSNKELYGFLFNDFLLLTYMVKQFVSSGSDKLFSPKSNSQFKMYKMVSELRCPVVVLLRWDPALMGNAALLLGSAIVPHLIVCCHTGMYWQPAHTSASGLVPGFINTFVHFWVRGQK